MIQMKIGDIVKNKESGTYGTLAYSTFGFSIHMWVKREEEGRLVFGKTLGATPSEILLYWDLVEEIPEGYQVHDYGGLIPINVSF